MVFWLFDFSISFRTTQLPLVGFRNPSLEFLRLQSHSPRSESPQPFFLPHSGACSGLGTLPCNMPVCLTALSSCRLIGQSPICANSAGSASSGFLKFQRSGSILRLPVISLISRISTFLFLITPSMSLWKTPLGRHQIECSGYHAAALLV